LPTRRQRNEFYTRAGKLLPPGAAGKKALAATQPDMEPGRILTALEKQINR
jgi:hypothetical protein